MKRRNILILFGIIAFLGMAGFQFLRSPLKTDHDVVEGTALIERGSIQIEVACTGKIVSNQDVEIKSEASGRVTRLPFDISAEVHVSSLLVELDPTDEQRNVEKAEATLEAARARLKSAKQELMIAEEKLKITRMNIKAEISSTRAAWEDAENKAQREEQLYEKKLSSREELDTRKTEAIRAKSAYEQVLARQEELKALTMELELKRQAVQLEESKFRSAKIDLEIANQRLDDTRILSPIEGVITTKNIQIGQIISSGIENIGGGTTLLVVSDLSRIFVIASVDESDIGKIQLGQKAEITVDSFPDLKFPGQVVQIATRGNSVSNVVTFEVKIEVLGDKKSLLKPEMTANVKIVAQEKSEALIVPEEAITFSTEGPLVKVMSSDGTIRSRAVTLGLSNGRTAEIVQGVEEGERVLLTPGQIHSQWSNTGKAE
ncbi:MAG: efflux RND transporter periplasmic adaptor subunit [bacterium]